MKNRLYIYITLLFYFNLYSQNINNLKFVRIIGGLPQNITGREVINYCPSNSSNIQRNISFDYNGYPSNTKFRLELVTESGGVTTFYKLLEESTSTSGSGSYAFNNIKFPHDAVLGGVYFLRIKTESPLIEVVYPAGYVDLDGVFPSDMDNIISEKRMICEDGIDEVLLEAEDKYSNYIYIWTKDGIEVSRGLGKTTIAVKQTGNYRYKLKKTETSTHECSSEYGRVLAKLEKIEFNLISETGELSGSCVSNDIKLKVESIKVGDLSDSYKENALDEDIIIKWFKDGVEMPSEKGKEYVVKTTGTYKVEILTCNGIRKENTFVVNMIYIDKIGGNVLCDNNLEIELKVLITGTNTYQWYKDGILLSGETQNSIKVTSKGKYKLKIQGNCNFETQEIEIKNIEDAKSQLVLSHENESIDILDNEQVKVEFKNSDSLYVEKDGQLFFSGKEYFNIDLKGEYKVDIFIGKCYITKNYKVENLSGLRKEIQNVINQGDFWVLPNSISNKPNIKVIIIDRYGIQVYNKLSYNNDWNGTKDENGKDLKKGVYYYFIVKDEKGLINGSLTLF